MYAGALELHVGFVWRRALKTLFGGCADWSLFGRTILTQINVLSRDIGYGDIDIHLLC